MTLISDREVTQVWEGVENTVRKSLDVLYKLEKSCDLCVDRNAPSVILTTEPIKQAYFDLKRRGIEVCIWLQVLDIVLSVYDNWVCRPCVGGNYDVVACGGAVLSWYDEGSVFFSIGFAGVNSVPLAIK